MTFFHSLSKKDHKLRKVISKLRRKKIDIFSYLDVFFFRFFKKIFYYFYKEIEIERKKSNYLHTKRILDYILEKHIVIKDFVKILDQESRFEIYLFLNRLKYVNKNNYLKKGKLVSFREFKKRNEINLSIIKAKKRYFLPKFEYDTSVFYKHCGLKYLPNHIIQQLKNKDFIDGGAYIGDSTLIFEKFYGPKTIVAIEPEMQNYELLLKTVHFNNLKKVIPIRKALGDEKKSLKLVSQSSGSQISKGGKEEIEMINIDELVNDYSLVVGLIKLDVEGYAKKILKGAAGTIKKQSPVLLIGIYHNGEELFESLDYILKINEKYKYIIRKIDPLDGIHEIMLIAWCSK